MSSSFITLGIETSCDETSIAVLEGERTVLSNKIFSSANLHKQFGGVVPEIASRCHLEALLPCLTQSLAESKKKLTDIDLIAVTQGPGLMGSLLVGVSAAKSLGLALQKPLVGVDHILAHLYAGVMVRKDLSFPLVGLVVSGGHTALILMREVDTIEVLGETRDDAAGEAFDKVAKILGLGYPGGPLIDRLAKNRNPQDVQFSRPRLEKNSLDFSFSGIKTAVLYRVEKLRKIHRLTSEKKGQIASAFQEAVCDVLVEKSIRACRLTGTKHLVVGGGVAANSRLQEKFKAIQATAGIEILFPPLTLTTDNAAMIAGYGYALYHKGKRTGLGFSAYSDFPETFLMSSHETSPVSLRGLKMEVPNAVQS